MALPKAAATFAPFTLMLIFCFLASGPPVSCVLSVDGSAPLTLEGDRVSRTLGMDTDVELAVDDKAGRVTLSEEAAAGASGSEGRLRFWLGASAAWCQLCTRV